MKLYLPRLGPEGPLHENGGREKHLAAGTDDIAVLLVAGNPNVTPLLTDVELPGGLNAGGLNGRQLVEATTRRRPRLRVLLCTTGYARNAIVHHGRLDPGIALITKPFSLSSLAAKLRNVLSARSPG